MQIHISRNAQQAGRAASEQAAELLREALDQRGRARVIVAAGNSQNELVDGLAARTDLEWPRIEIFHMDEYVGIPASHPASFRKFVKDRLVDRVPVKTVHYLNGDAPDIEAECRRYTALLAEAPMDLAFVGFGENGHIAFNDPHVADFHDPLRVKRVEMDVKCRAQQVGEGHFASVEAVPQYAITLTCSALFDAAAWVCVVTDKRKAEAVRGALQGPVSEACPASVVRQHPHAFVYLDDASASLLA